MPDEKLPRFGASDFFLTDTDPVVIREKLRAALAEVLGRDVVDSDPHMVLASAFMPYLVQGLASIDACAKATLRAYATGADLDRIADSTCAVGYLNRKPALPAILPCLLKLDIVRSSAADASDCVVAWHLEREFTVDGERVIFSGGGEFVHNFALTDGLRAEFQAPVYLRCAEAGPKFNGLASDTSEFLPDDYLTSVADITVSEAPSTHTGQEFSVEDLAVAIAGETYGGSDAESDEDFSERVAWQAKALRVPGSLEYFKLLLSGLTLLPSAYISPTLDDDGRIVMAWADKPTRLASAAGLTLSNRGAAYEEFLRAVQGALLVEQHAYAYEAQVFGDPTVAFRVTYKIPYGVPDEAAARDRVRQAFKAWRSSVAWHCGAFVRRSDAIAAVVAAGAVDVTASSALPIPSSAALPADRFLMASQISLLYNGVGASSTPAEGGSGEDITPV